MFCPISLFWYIFPASRNFRKLLTQNVLNVALATPAAFFNHRFRTLHKSDKISSKILTEKNIRNSKLVTVFKHLFESFVRLNKQVLHIVFFSEFFCVEVSYSKRVRYAVFTCEFHYDFNGCFKVNEMPD